MNTLPFQRILPALWLALCFTFTAQAQTVLNLTECMEYAFENHPDLKIAELQIADAEWQIKENKAFGYPQLSANLGYQYFLEVPAIPASALGFGQGDERIAFQLRNNISGTAQWDQLLFSNDYILGLRAAKVYRELAEEQYATTRRTVRDRVIDAYLPTLLISESVRIIDKNIESIEQLLKETRATQEAGFSEQLDVDRLELNLSILRTDRENVLRRRKTVINALKFSMGYPVTDELDVADNIERLLAEYGVVDTTLTLELNNRPEYRQILKAQELQTLEEERYQRPWMPVVNAYINGTGSYQGNSELFWVPSSVAGVSAFVNIWDGGITKARRERARVGLEEVMQQKTQLVNAINLEVENARQNYINALANMRNQEKNLELTERILDTTRKKYQAGVGSSFELVTTEQQLYGAQRSLLEAQYELLNAWTDFKQALAIN